MKHAAELRLLVGKAYRTNTDTLLQRIPAYCETAAEKGNFHARFNYTTPVYQQEIKDLLAPKGLDVDFLNANEIAIHWARNPT
jgi:hypothetical protein